MTVGAMFSNGRLAIHAGGKSYQILESDSRFKRVIKLLEDNAPEKKLIEALDVVKTIQKRLRSLGKVEIKNNQVYVNGEVSQNTVAKRIIDFAHRQLPFKHLLTFLSRLEANENPDSRKQLYRFLEHKSLPITTEGMVLAYKYVNNDWTDNYTGKIDNSIGKTVSMDRKLVDPNPDSHCSVGLHVGVLDYVRSNKPNGGRIVLVSFDPADAVSVPTDANFMKLRVCKYKVIEEMKQELTEPLYNPDASNYNYQDDDQYDEDDVESYDDEEEDDEDLDDILPDNGKCCRGDCGSGQATGNDYAYLAQKPNGQAYHNKRGPNGKFIKK